MIRTTQKGENTEDPFRQELGVCTHKTVWANDESPLPLTALRSSGLGIQTNPTKAAGLEQGGTMGTDLPASFLLVPGDPQARQCHAFG